jgi:hypothetical protein
MPLSGASRFLTPAANTEYNQFPDCTVSVGTFGFFGNTDTRKIKTCNPDAEYPFILVEDNLSSAAAASTLFNFMDAGAVITPSGNVTSTPAFNTAAGGCGTQNPSTLPSNGTTFSLASGLQHFNFTGQTWALHPTGGIDWDVYESADQSGSPQWMIGNWGHDCTDTREQAEYEAANSVGSFSEIQDQFRVHGSGQSFYTLILPYRKTETPTRTVSTISSGTGTCPIGSTSSTEIVQGAETTCINPSLISFTSGTVNKLMTLDTSSQTGFSMTLSGCPEELSVSGTTGLWTMSSINSNTCNVTLPSGTWFPSPSSGVSGSGNVFSYNFSGGPQVTPVAIAFSQSGPAGGGSQTAGHVLAAGQTKHEEER